MRLPRVWFTIRNLMIAILAAALVAGLLIAMASTGSEVAQFLVLSIGTSFALITAFWEVWLWAIDVPMPPDVCPRCRRGLIARVAVSRHGERFYRCTLCGARYQRTSRDAPWTDASGWESDAIDSPSEPSIPGKTMAPPVEMSLFWTQTVSVLLRNKRMRQLSQGAKDHGGLWDSELDG